MLNEPTHQKLIEMRLGGMATAYETQLADPEISALDFATRFGLLVEAEALHRDNRRLTRYLQVAKLRIPSACMEDLKCSPARGLDRALARQLMTGRAAECCVSSSTVDATDSRHCGGITMAIACSTSGSTEPSSYAPIRPRRTARLARIDGRELARLLSGIPREVRRRSTTQRA